MGTIAQMKRAWQAINLTEEAKDIMVQTHDVLESLQTDQLYAGLDSDGKPISPKYSEDPWFKSKEAALRYAQWKAEITPDPRRPLDIPNLYIVGRYHNSIRMKVTGKKYAFKSDDPNARSIERKFNTALGMSEDSKQKYRKTTLNPMLVKRIAAKTGARTS